MKENRENKKVLGCGGCGIFCLISFISFMGLSCLFFSPLEYGSEAQKHQASLSAFIGCAKFSAFLLALWFLGTWRRGRFLLKGVLFFIFCLVHFIIGFNFYSDRPIASMYNDEAITLYKQGKYDEALPVAKRALEQARVDYLNDRYRIPTYLLNLAEVYKSLERYKDAERYYREVYEQDYGVLWPGKKLYHFTRLLEFYIETKSLDKAELMVSNELKLLDSDEFSEESTVRVNKSVAKLYTLQNRIDEADALYNKILALLEPRWIRRDLKIDVYEDLILFYTKAKRDVDREKAEQYLLDLKKN